MIHFDFILRRKAQGAITKRPVCLFGMSLWYVSLVYLFNLTFLERLDQIFQVANLFHQHCALVSVHN